jgi:aerobic carbon-monoxide dehydrogenase medium subunit
LKCAAFAYARPSELETAIDLLAAHSDGGQILAGGQSLLPVMNFRLSAPTVLIDINRIDELRGIEIVDHGVRIGALARHFEVAESEIVRHELPLLREAMEHVAHPAVRNRGTFGGSIALADPAAEMPACAVALDATIVLASKAGRRLVPARKFFQGLYSTDRRSDEILTETIFPRRANGDRDAFAELSRRHGDFAVTGVSCHAAMDGDRIKELSLVVFGCEAFPRIAEHTRQAANGKVLSRELAAEVAAVLKTDLQPIEDIHGDRAVKLHFAEVLARRIIEQMAGA